MRIFRKYPYTDFHELNADWILEEIQKAAQETEQSAQQAEEAAATVAGYEDRLQAVETICAAVPGLAQSVSSLRQSVQALQNSVSNLITITGQMGMRLNGLETRISAAETSLGETVRFTAQTLTDAQKAQARSNIGAADPGQAAEGSVRYDVGQALSASERARARSNIGAMQTDEPWANAPLTLISEGSAASEADEIQLGVDSELNNSVLRLSGDQSNTVRIAGIADPLEDDEAAPKEYVDIQAQPFVIVKTGSAVSVDMTDELQAPNTIIACGELASLAITDPVRSWYQLTIRFTSGSTPTAFAPAPSGLLGLENFEPEANTIYEINIMDLRAVIGVWEVVA